MPECSRIAVEPPDLDTPLTPEEEDEFTQRLDAMMATCKEVEEGKSHSYSITMFFKDCA